MKCHLFPLPVFLPHVFLPASDFRSPTPDFGPGGKVPGPGGMAPSQGRNASTPGGMAPSQDRNASTPGGMAPGQGRNATAPRPELSLFDQLARRTPREASQRPRKRIFIVKGPPATTWKHSGPIWGRPWKFQRAFWKFQGCPGMIRKSLQMTWRRSGMSRNIPG